MKDNPLNGIRTVRRSLVILGMLSTAFAMMVMLAAPWLVRWVLGPGFTPAIPVLRVLGLMVPLQAVCTVITAQWVLPLGLDGECTFVVTTQGMIGVVVAMLLTPRMGALGMSIAVALAQLYALVALEIILRRKGLSPFMRGEPSVQVIGRLQAGRNLKRATLA